MRRLLTISSLGVFTILLGEACPIFETRPTEQAAFLTGSGANRLLHGDQFAYLNRCWPVVV
jgi:hypothetical protein